MNLKLISLLSISILAISSCKKLDEFTKFNMDFEETITIPASQGINLPFNILTPDISSNSESTFEINDTRKDLIEKINLVSMTLKIESPTSGNFNFLKNIELFINADGLEEVKMAYKLNMQDNNLVELNLDVNDTDLKEYIKKDKFQLRCATTTDEVLTQDHQISVKYVMYVDAKLIK
jgi:hypothetical protein